MLGKILIVDDSPDFRALLKRFVEGQGHEAAEAKNGKIAIEYLLSNPLPDLVLLDSEMDVMSGSEFLTELERSHPEILEKLRIIVLSGVKRFAHPKIIRSMRKPVTLDELETAISSAISSHHGRPGARESDS